MPYVERTDSGDVKGLYARPQPGRAEELLDDNDPEVLAFNLNADAPGPNDTLDLIHAMVGTPQQQSDAKNRLRKRLT